MGYEEEAREIAIERRVQQRLADDRRGRRLVSWGLHTLADYGFNPWKTVRWAIKVWFLFGIVYALTTSWCTAPGCRDGTVWAPAAIAAQDPAVLEAPRPGAPSPAAPPLPGGQVVSDAYPAFMPFAHSLDLLIPLLPLGVEGDWRPNTGRIERELAIPGGIQRGDGSRTTLPLTLSWGRILVWVTIVQEIVGALLIALAVTGFTGLLGRDDR